MNNYLMDVTQGSNTCLILMVVRRAAVTRAQTLLHTAGPFHPSALGGLGQISTVSQTKPLFLIKHPVEAILL